MNSYNKFIKNVSLEIIQPLEIMFSRRGDFQDNKESVDIKLKLSYLGDISLDEKQKLVLRPSFEIDLTQDDSSFYHQRTDFVVVIKISSKEVFEETWADEEVKQKFLEMQIKKTIWPILRQQVLDGMSRLGLPAIPLPWLI